MRCTALAVIVLVGCGGGSQATTGAVAGALSLAAGAAHATARRAAGECFTPCTHATRCDRASGLCVPGREETVDPDLGGPRPPLQMARAVIDAQRDPAVTRPQVAPPTVEPSSDFDCDVGDGSHQMVQATSSAGAREVCLAWNDVDPSGPACACTAHR
jgi:hypothetical protein